MAPTQKIVSGTGHRPATAIRRARFAMEHGLLLPRCVVRLMDAIHPRDQNGVVMTQVPGDCVRPRVQPMPGQILAHGDD